MANYINNKKMYSVIKEYSKKVKDAEDSGEEKPQIPNYLGECFIQIANRLSRRPNFFNYTYKEEMISDGIENCIMAIDNFDCEKTNNPFAYFTQVIWYAFLRRIEKEKKQTYVKYKSFQEMNTLGLLTDTNDSDSDASYTVNVDDEYMYNLIETFEKKKKSTKKKTTAKKKKGVEVFYDEDKQ